MIYFQSYIGSILSRDCLLEYLHYYISFNPILVQFYLDGLQAIYYNVDNFQSYIGSILSFYSSLWDFQIYYFQSYIGSILSIRTYSPEIIAFPLFFQSYIGSILSSQYGRECLKRDNGLSILYWFNFIFRTL